MDAWPKLDWQEWRETAQTLHLYSQIVGKIRLALSPWLNHGWHVTLYVSPRGLTTSTIFLPGRAFSLEFDFLAHCLRLQTSDGGNGEIPLQLESVAAFHAALLELLRRHDIQVSIHGSPNEVPNPVPFALDHAPRTYDPEAAQRFWRALISIEQTFQHFRTGFLGKSSPVHFFWGSFDLAVTRFSGREAPVHPGGIPALPDAVTREAYSHEVSSAGFWPGSDEFPEPIFYSYAYPSPAEFAAASVEPAEAYFDAGMGEFILKYSDVSNTSEPEKVLMSFLQSTFNAAAELGGWDRGLECPPGLFGTARPV